MPSFLSPKSADRISFETDMMRELEASEKPFFKEVKFRVLDTGIEMDAVKLFKLINSSTNLDRKSIMRILDVFTPIFRGIMGADLILRTVSLLTKGSKEKLFDLLNDLLQLMLAVYMNKSLKKKQLFGAIVKDGDLVKKLKEQNTLIVGKPEISDNLAVTSWLQGVLMVLDKEKKFDNSAE